MPESYGLPQALQAAIAAVTAGASWREEAARLSARYRAGGTSQGAVGIAAYLATRLPATYAASLRAFAELSRLQPEFAPSSLLDIGAGPGTVSWAAAAIWPTIGTITLLDHNPDFLALAGVLLEGASHPALKKAERLQGAIGQALPRADLVAAAYVLAELPQADAARAALSLWEAATSSLVLVEPGTPAGFARIAGARAALIEAGAHPVAPCPHAKPCPVQAPDWCHFSVRLPRSRIHMHAKGASLPFEDEKFAWTAVSRIAAVPVRARILAPPQAGKAAIRFKVCTPAGTIEQRAVARRDAVAFRDARKRGWGDNL
jgi:ribosomal protein RSM22 (predicted rRNA methylase)